MNVIALLVVCLTAYALSLGLLLLGLSLRKPISAIIPTFGIAVASHALLCYQLVYVLPAQNEIIMNFYVATLLIVFLASLIGYLLHLYKRQPLLLLSLATASLLTLLLVLINNDALSTIKHYDNATAIHAALSFSGFGFFALAALQATSLKISSYFLKQKRNLNWLQQFPPIVEMERLLFIEIAIGFILLNLAFISGYFALADIFSLQVIHKTVLSLAAWLLFGFLLVRHYFYGLRGQLAVNYILLGFALLMMAFLGSLFVRQVILNQ
ncbi:MAG: cytochrome c biogenesis protein CcsA [Pseudomonadota bacterium]|nr:cytochrome c biogenesis protein CcsA [Pseudomonadota bacterium]